MLFFKSRDRKARQQAREWLALARKVDHYRRDVIPDIDLSELRARRETLEATLSEKKVSLARLEQPVRELESLLKRVGGSFYPRGFWVENVEMVVVGAIVIIALRAFFLQPFKIPTNSMYPTYNGITATTWFQEDMPSAPMRGMGFIRLGSTFRTIEGDPGDELILPLDTYETLLSHRVGNPRGALDGPNRGAFLSQRIVPSRQWLIFPSTRAEYRFIVGKQTVTVRVPLDFPMSDVLSEILDKAGSPALIERGRGDSDYLLRTGLRADERGRILAFSVNTGDNLFVDRFTYHFRQPKVGEPFVFRTNDIVGMDPSERNKYYIKRIAGAPGDTVQIDPPSLVINGEPADQVRAFLRNASQEGNYPGYQFARPNHFFQGSEPLTLPQEHYLALGDNAPHSADSRMWGLVPEHSIVGKAIFIYYPFSFRWGVAE